MSYEIRNLNFFLSLHQILKILCVDEVLSVSKPKSSNKIPKQKIFVKSLKIKYGNPDPHAFFTFFRTYPRKN